MSADAIERIVAFKLGMRSFDLPSLQQINALVILIHQGHCCAAGLLGQ